MEYKTKEYVAAFIDVLGATKMIDADSEKSLNVVHEVYNQALRSRDKLYNVENIASLKPIVKIYSDNIVVAVPTDVGNAFSAFLSVAILSGLIQHEFLHHKCLVRGGIAMGDFFADDLMIWGNALLDAYYIESNISIYPRIVIHPKTVEKLQLTVDARKQKWIKQDADGFFFVDYMQETAVKAFVELLIIRVEQASELLEMYTEDVKVAQKILWHRSYLQSKIDFYAPEYSEKLKQEIEEIKATKTRIEDNKT